MKRAVSVVDAMRQVPRVEFLPDDVRERAGEDKALPIGYEQTISQPSLVAKMTQFLELTGEERVLEIGTGSGYQAAILSLLVKDVYSVEIIPELAESAKERLLRLGFKNVHLRLGDGYEGWGEHAPFDAAIVTCAPHDIPPPLIEQLAEGGRLVIPVGPRQPHQTLHVLRKINGQLEKKSMIPVMFVPMTGSHVEGPSHGD